MMFHRRGRHAVQALPAHTDARIVQGHHLVNYLTSDNQISQKKNKEGITVNLK